MLAGSKDFVFIDYETRQMCEEAIRNLNGKIFDSNSKGPMKVTHSWPFSDSFMLKCLVIFHAVLCWV